MHTELYHSVALRLRWGLSSVIKANLHNGGYFSPQNVYISNKTTTKQGATKTCD